jgi:hypothetical protein
MSSFTKPPVRPQPPKSQPQPSKTELKTAVPAPIPEQRAEDGSSYEDQIRPLAYQNWQDAGCPACDGVEFWLAAETEILRRKKPR